MKQLKEIREQEEITYLYKNHAETELTAEDLNKIAKDVSLLKNKTMEFSYTARLVNLTCKRCIRRRETKSKLELYDKITGYVAEKLDIVHYIKSLENLDRAILLLLNTEQKSAFEFIKRPNLTDEAEMACFEIDFNKDPMKRAVNVINYYIRKAKEGDLDDKDREIFPLINPSLKKFMFKTKE
jgi:hypothetical protein